MRQVTERCAEATIRRYVIAVLSVMRRVCIVCVCEVPSCCGGPGAGVASE